jgi:hypothetical protein
MEEEQNFEVKQSPSSDTSSLSHYQEILYLLGLEPPQNARRQEGKVQPVPYFVPTRIARHDRNVTRSGHLASGIIVSLT